MDWKTPDRMEMIREDDERVYRERKLPACKSNGLSQHLDVIHKRFFAPIEQVDCEEPASAGNECATIIWHRRFTFLMVRRITLR